MARFILTNSSAILGLVFEKGEKLGLQGYGTHQTVPPGNCHGHENFNLRDKVEKRTTKLKKNNKLYPRTRTKILAFFMPFQAQMVEILQEIIFYMYS
jgi:hypothetical protein